MAKDIRILMVEDVAADAVVINHELRRSGVSFATKRVETREKFLHELQHNRPDIILSDHGVPDFDGFAALAIARNKCPDVPFIFVTGSMGEEIAIETLKSGAVDYVLKDRLSVHLVPAIQRALREAEERRKRHLVEQALQESEEQFRLLVQGVKDYALCMLDPEGRVMSWNAGAEWIMGYTADEIISQHCSRFYTPEDIAAGKTDGALRRTIADGRHEEEIWLQRKGGSRFIANTVINVLRDHSGQVRGFAHVTRDITQIKQAQEALLKSWTRCQQLVELFPDAVMVQSNGDIVFVNESAIRLLGANGPEQLTHKPLQDFVHPANWERLHAHMKRLREEGTAFFIKRTHETRGWDSPWASIEAQLIRVDGSPVDVMLIAAPLSFQEQPAMMVFAYAVGAHK